MARPHRELHWLRGVPGLTPTRALPLPAAQQEHWPSALGTSVLIPFFLVLPGLALKAHVGMLEQPF